MRRLGERGKPEAHERLGWRVWTYYSKPKGTTQVSMKTEIEKGEGRVASIQGGVLLVRFLFNPDSNFMKYVCFADEEPEAQRG